MKSKRRHLLILALCVFVLVMSFVLKVNGDEVCLDGKTMAGVCCFKEVTHLDCPGCGLTRSVISARQLEINKSVLFHPAGWLILLLILLQIPYRLACLAKGGLESQKIMKLLAKTGKYILIIVVVSGAIKYIT